MPTNVEVNVGDRLLGASGCTFKVIRTDEKGVVVIQSEVSGLVWELSQNEACIGNLTLLKAGEQK